MDAYIHDRSSQLGPRSQNILITSQCSLLICRNLALLLPWTWPPSPLLVDAEPCRRIEVHSSLICRLIVDHPIKLRTPQSNSEYSATTLTLTDHSARWKTSLVAFSILLLCSLVRSLLNVDRACAAAPVGLPTLAGSLARSAVSVANSHSGSSVFCVR